MFADPRNAGAIGLVADLDWPPRAVTMRVLDLDGREIHSRSRATLRVSVYVARRAVRGFLSPNAPWMAASRKYPSFPNTTSLDIRGSCLSSKIRYDRLADRSTSPRREHTDRCNCHCRGGEPTKSLEQGPQRELAHDLFSRSHQHDYDHDWNRSNSVDDRAQNKALIGSSGVKFRIAPTKVASAIAP
jgi:hypothetical protein